MERLGAVDLGQGRTTASGRSGSGAAHGGGVVAAREAAWDACGRGRAPRGGPGGVERFPRVHLAAGARWTKSTGGVRRAARTEQAGGERDGDKGIFVISENPGPLSKLKLSPIWRAQIEKC